MKSLDEMEYFADSEKLVSILVNKTQNNNPLFFRVLVAYYFSKITSMMRIDINTHDRGKIPVSLYVLNLVSSGAGKGFSTNIMEEQVISEFKTNFVEDTFPAIAEGNIEEIAKKRAIKKNEVYEDVLDAVKREFNQLGALVFSFDSGTTPAVKQMRQKLLMAEAGSVNLEIDEFGSNLLSNVEVLNTFLELFDIGKVKQKLTKNTNDNKRSEEIDGRTPTNMMLFGTPSKLLNGGKIEEEFYAMLETGYARRCLFGYYRSINKMKDLTPEQVYDMMTDSSSEAYIKDLSERLGKLAGRMNFGNTLEISKDNSLLLIEYKLKCEKIAENLKEHEDIFKAEISHRYYKALKLAGAYAFIEGNHEVTEDNLYAAIKLVEDSGNAFKDILTRERNYVKLAKYIADIGREVTQVDLIEDLPFYRGGDTQKKELMALATAYGYKNNIIIKRSYIDGIEFLNGESMEITDLDKMKLSYSTQITENYIPETVPFDVLHKVVTVNGYHYAAHHYRHKYRKADNIIEGFNLVILDVDGGINIKTAQLLLQEYKTLFATTKRHTADKNRFRIIIPLSHTVKLNPENYSKFMLNVFNWLPFDVDQATKDCARKWESHKGTYEYNEGKLLDAMLFIPQTKKEEEQTKKVLDANGLSNLERWFHMNTDTGNRSNQLIKYALALVDNDYTFEQVKQSITDFNDKLKSPISDNELANTILISAMKAITKRDSE